jgi:HSP20 family molecular chaperone IbpA
MYNSRFDKLIDGIFEGFASPTYSTFYKNTEKVQPYEINYTKDGAYLIFEVPGFNKSNLKVEMEDGTLYVEGTRTYKRDGEDTTKSVNQVFKIGREYDSSNIEATIEDGILSVFVHSYKKSEKKKRISLL